MGDKSPSEEDQGNPLRTADKYETGPWSLSYEVYVGFHGVPFSMIILIIIVFLTILFTIKQHFVGTSTCLMISGFVTGAILYAASKVIDNQDSFLIIDAAAVENFFKPPIFMHAAYNLYSHQTLNQWKLITVYGCLATVFTIGVIMGTFMVEDFFDVSKSRVSDQDAVNIFQELSFSTMLAAVDPESVLHELDTVGADPRLYYLVFGEDMLNTAVCFFMYQGLQQFVYIKREDLSRIPTSSYLYLAGGFLVKPIIGSVVGIIAGLLSALVTKYMTEKSMVFAPHINLLFGASTYFTASIFHKSGIMSVVFFCLFQRRYTFRNITEEAGEKTLIIVDGAAHICEHLLFFFIGTHVISVNWKEVYSSVLYSLLGLYLARTVIMVTLTLFVKSDCTDKGQMKWRWLPVLILGGGMRGAIAYAMVMHYDGPHMFIFFDVIIAVIFVTTIVNGISCKILISFFDLRPSLLDHVRDIKKEKRLNDITWLEEKLGLTFFLKEEVVQEQREMENATAEVENSKKDLENSGEEIEVEKKKEDKAHLSEVERMKKELNL